MEVELKLFRLLWKLAFRLDNDDCRKNRLINCQMLIILTERHSSEIYNLISDDKEYYSNISNLINKIRYIIIYLSKFKKNLFCLLSQGAQTIIREICKKDDECLLYGWFVHDSLTDYYNTVLNCMNTNLSFFIEEYDWKNVFNFSDNIEWEMQVNQLITFYYCSASSNDIALERSNSTILPCFDKFNNQEKIEFLLTNIELSYQLCNKENLKRSHQFLRKHFEKILPKEFDFTVYPQFNAQTLQETFPDISQLNKLD
ncbi:unnamed protein product [Commensalibacter communis]|uniref:hypothetical protein n=1 Tax=Commensalibacter communis TaxID=2972786 RepID=UPI0022FF8290|nr:hypothetical protein [Commensalibacter communis]CAI3922156.1 unnamed protein product [Commensalibacter communis]CAI3938019.1 unnamed protein product [Commensalibacter communis]